MNDLPEWAALSGYSPRQRALLMSSDPPLEQPSAAADPPDWIPQIISGGAAGGYRGLGRAALGIAENAVDPFGGWGQLLKNLLTAGPRAFAGWLGNNTPQPDLTRPWPGIYKGPLSEGQTQPFSYRNPKTYDLTNEMGNPPLPLTPRARALTEGIAP